MRTTNTRERVFFIKNLLGNYDAMRNARRQDHDTMPFHNVKKFYNNIF